MTPYAAMLSYLHAFHAGNHADVLKHAVLTVVLDYLVRKDRSVLFVDTHAGAGRYDLRAERSAQRHEYSTGIGRLWAQPEAVPSSLQRYLAAVRALNPGGTLRHYPGSPWLAGALLRPRDYVRLYELHPQEYAQLRARFSGLRNVRVEQADGLRALRAVLPPPGRRGVVLVDPSYEMKTDYRAVVTALTGAHRRFATGVYLLWYPVVSRMRVRRLEQDLVASGMRNILLAELCIAADAPQGGMTGSGMLVINPPWPLADTLRTLLPYLQHTLAGPGGGFRLLPLVAE
jgi:23S rRNA (adenine2030-N6)-methyltransferase